MGWLYHDIRFNSGSWQGWGQPANPPGPLRYFGDLSITAPTFLGYDDDTLYVTAQTEACP